VRGSRTDQGGAASAGSANRESVRVPGYDYRVPGAFIITQCTHRRALLLGRIANCDVVLASLGQLVAHSLQGLPEHFTHVDLDAWVIMPNHVHFVLLLIGRGTIYRAPTRETFGAPVPGSLPTVIRTFKASVTRTWRTMKRDQNIRAWQRGYFERGVRNEKELRRIRQTILQNPARWNADAYFAN
jgi:putative transposase